MMELVLLQDVWIQIMLSTMKMRIQMMGHALSSFKDLNVSDASCDLTDGQLNLWA